MRIYVDTNVIMDFFLDRRSSSVELFKNTLRCFHSIVISDVVLSELHFQKIDATSLIKILRSSDKIDIIRTEYEDKIDAKDIKETHYNDALHYLLAKRAKVDCLVTSNIKDFSTFKDVRIQSPDALS